MFNFTDAEVAMNISCNAAIDRTVRHSQAIVDRKNAELGLYIVALANARNDVAAERQKRQAAEFEVARLRRMLAQKH